MSALADFKILVVEDDTSLSRVMATSLRKKGAHVVVANNGREGFKALAESGFDLVLSDVQMPQMDGLELLAKIRERNPELPVFLLVTGQAQLTEPEALGRGAAGLMQKPFKLSVLIERLEAFIASGVLKRTTAA